MSTVFADALQVTFDRADWRSVRNQLLPILQTMGCETAIDSPATETGLWRSPSGAVLKAERYSAVVALGASGQFLALLRAHNFFHEYLATIGTVPHKVTRLDATMDVDTDAPPVLRRLMARGKTGRGIQLTRKMVPPRQIRNLFSLRLDGRDSGTVYFGSKTAPVRLCLYDKQHERQEKGVLDAPPCLRFELRLRHGLVTLRDAAEPASVFWHSMSGVLTRPEGIPEWAPANDPYRPERLTFDPDLALRRRIERSSDLKAIVALADSMPGGRARLFAEIGWAYPVQPAAESQAA